jgi:hypothetical protein
MKKSILLILTALLILSSAGCIYTKIEQPGDVKTSTQHKLTSSDFKILGRVSVTGETILWFGAVLTGGKGYQALLKQAQEMGGDAIMDYSFDVEYESILWFVYAKAKWKATGIAVKYNEELKR